jgi:hypothetical protein
VILVLFSRVTISFTTDKRFLVIKETTLNANLPKRIILSFLHSFLLDEVVPVIFLRKIAQKLLTPKYQR